MSLGARAAPCWDAVLLPSFVPLPRQAESGSVEILDTLAFLLGSWNLERSIEDHRSGACGSFSGTAALVWAQARLGLASTRRARYDETGELRFGAHTGPASRHLEYARHDGAAVMIYFADGRPFTDLDLRGGAWRAVHPCGEDRYEITTILRSDRVVEEEWRVRGPSTSYDAITTLTRLDLIVAVTRTAA
jgi:hypothetical protein